MDSISIIPEFNKYLTDLTEEELKLREENINNNNNENVIDAICKILKDM